MLWLLLLLLLLRRWLDLVLPHLHGETRGALGLINDWKMRWREIVGRYVALTATWSWLSDMWRIRLLVSGRTWSLNKGYAARLKRTVGVSLISASLDWDGPTKHACGGVVVARPLSLLHLLLLAKPCGRIVAARDERPWKREHTLPCKKV